MPTLQGNILHEAFEGLLNSIAAKKETMDLYVKIRKAFFAENNDEANGNKKIQTEIDKAVIQPLE